jgi:formiminotetrahydrofolate cyclodeaminase
MAARLSQGWPEARGAAAQAEALRLRVMPLAEQNADAYEEAVEALGGKASPTAGSKDEAIEDALARAAQVPLEIASAAADVSALAATVAEAGEPSLRPDAAIAASLCVAGARAAATLVEVNLGTTPEDQRLESARVFTREAEQALERALAAVV